MEVNGKFMLKNPYDGINSLYGFDASNVWMGGRELGTTLKYGITMEIVGHKIFLIM